MCQYGRYILFSSERFGAKAATIFTDKQLVKGKIMGACGCGYTTDPEKNCNGTHNVVKAVKADLIAKLEENGHADAAELLKSK